MAENVAPPLPEDSVNDSDPPPPLPPTEPLPQSRSSKRLGIGEGDGTNEPPVKKTRRETTSSTSPKVGKDRKKLKASFGNKRTATEKLSREDGELEDSDDNALKDGKNVTETIEVTPSESAANAIAVGTEKCNTDDAGVDGTKENGDSGSGGVSSSAITADASSTVPETSASLSEVDSAPQSQSVDNAKQNEAEKNMEHDGNEEEGGNNGREEHLDEEFDSALIPQQFAVIDDLEESDEENHQEQEEEAEGEGENEEYYDSDLDEMEVEALLEEDFEKKKDDTEEKDFYIKEKEILVEPAHDPFDILPELWIRVTHNSGIPVYLHRTARVCTLSRPYFLGTGSARRHNIPASAIPCLNYVKAMEGEFGATRGDNIPEVCDPKQLLLKKPTEQTSKENHASEDQPKEQTESTEESCKMESENSTPTENESSQTETSQNSNEQSIDSSKAEENAEDKEIEDKEKEDKKDENKAKDQNKEESKSNEVEEPVKPAYEAKIASVEEHKQSRLLKPEQVKEYCSKLFQFKKMYVKRFRSWKVRRAYHRAQNNPHQKPSLPVGTKLLMCKKSSTKKDLAGFGKRKEFMLNPKGKSDICILHEYAQHTLRVQPKYIFEETANAQQPYSATITINNVKYGTGTSNSKKGAKANAAHETLKILIPDVLKLRNSENKEEASQDMAFFNDVKIEDPRVAELSAKAGEPMPFEILQECLKRNYGLGDTNLTMSMNMIKAHKSEFAMKVSNYEAKVVCKNKRDGKQRAAQVIIQQMHPHVVSWGSILRLYARDHTVQQEIKAQKDSITSLQCKVTLEPNHAILSKLKEEMHKLKDRRKQVEANIKGRLEMPGIELQSSVMGHVDLN